VRHIPNVISVLRILLVWPIIASIAAGEYRLTLLLCFIAAVSDALDGFLAKRFQWTSALGKFLDPMADKLLLISVFLLLTWYGLIPRALTSLVVARDVMIALGALAYRIGWGPLPLHGGPKVSSKINTLLQLLYVLAVVARQGFGLPSRSVLAALALLTVGSIVVSGYVYVREIAQRALSLARA
jgi:cardiolipin synthase (CMP-forming)